MNAPAFTAEPRPRRRFWKWLGLSVLSVFILSLIGVASMFFLDGDAATLRDEMVDARGKSSVSTKVQLSFGPISLGLARTALGFVEGVDDEARLALSAVRAVSVGVYSLASDTSLGNLPDFDFSHLDSRMQDRGWARMIAVRDHGKVILVYGPSEMSSRRTLPMCIAVLDGAKLVIVSLRGDPEPILKIARTQLSKG